MVLCLIAGNLAAQSPPQIGVYGPQHYNIYSYDGLVHTDLHRVHITLQGQFQTYSRWSLRATITQPFHSQPANVSGRTFPEDKLKFRFIDEQINGNPPLPHPTLHHLQVPLTGIPFLPAGSETPIVTQAPVPLATGNSHYVEFNYRFKIDVEGGRYLGDMLSDIGGNPWNQQPAIYRSSIRFVLYNEQQQAVAQVSYPITLQVHRPLQNPPPEEESLSLEVLGAARDATLAFTSPESYLQENSITYGEGVRVQARTGYQIQVKSSQSALFSQQGHSLPLDVLAVRLHRATNAPLDANAQTIRLSTVPQTVLTTHSGHVQPQYYHLQYSTEMSDRRLMSVRAGRYSTVLIYEISPR